METRMAITEFGDDLVTDARVVLVDVRPERRAILRTMVDIALGAGTAVAQVATATEAVAAVERHSANCAVVEIQLPVAEGLATIAALRGAYPSLTIVVCSFHAGAGTQSQSRDAGADAYLVKPVGTRELRGALGARHQADLIPPAALATSSL
jgi:CheY-like chemotaxis protein